MVRAAMIPGIAQAKAEVRRAAAVAQIGRLHFGGNIDRTLAMVRAAFRVAEDDMGRPGIEQHPDNILISLIRSAHQRGPSIVGPRVDIRSPVQKQSDHVRAVAERGGHQRRQPPLVR